MAFLRRNGAALCLIALAAAFIALGVWREETETILRKAVNLCMECVGLG